MTTLIISNEEMENIVKIVKSLKEFCLLIKGVSETIKNETKEHRGGFLDILLGTLGTSLLGNLLTVKGVMRAGEGIIRAGKVKIRADQDFKLLILLILLTLSTLFNFSDFLYLYEYRPSC